MEWIITNIDGDIVARADTELQALIAYWGLTGLMFDGVEFTRRVEWARRSGTIAVRQRAVRQ